jgi:hypothetical protein
MVNIVLYYTKDVYDIFNIQDGYLIIKDKEFFPTIEYNEKYNKFTFTIDETNIYTMKVNLDNHIYDCFTQDLYLNNEIIDPLMYRINFEEIEDNNSSKEDDEDSCG